MTTDLALRSVAEVLNEPGRRADLFNAFPSLVWCADARGACSFVNQAWVDYTGAMPPLELAAWLVRPHSGTITGLQGA